MVKALNYQNPLLKPLDALMLPNIPNGNRPQASSASALRPIAPSPIRPITSRPAPIINQPLQSNGIFNPFPMAPVRPRPQPIQPIEPIESGPKPNILRDLALGLLSSAQRVGGTAAQGLTALATIPDILPAAFGDENALRQARMKTQFINDVREGEALDGGSMSFINKESQEGTATPVEFARDFIDAGVETANLIPITRGATVAVKSGEAGAKALTAAAAKQALANNAREAVIYGTSTTANDALQGREITPEGVATNFLAPIVLGTGSELLGRGAKDLGRVLKDAQTGPGSQRGSIMIPGGKPSPEDAQYINKTVAETSSPEKFRQDMIDMLWQQNKKGSGVDTSLIPVGPGEGSGYSGRVSMSNNSPLYQAFYKEYGRKPTKTAIIDMVDQHLGIKETGDYKNLITEAEGSPFDSSIYAALKEREANIPSYVPKGKEADYLKSNDFKQDQDFKRMASETKSGDPYDHPDMYDDPSPEMFDNLKPGVNVPPAPQVGKTDPNRNWKLRNQVDDGNRKFSQTKSALSKKIDEFTAKNNGKPFTAAQKKELGVFLKDMDEALDSVKQANEALNPTPQTQATAPKTTGTITQPTEPGWRAKAGPGKTTFIREDGTRYTKSYDKLTPEEIRVDELNSKISTRDAIDNALKADKSGPNSDSRKRLNRMSAELNDEVKKLGGQPSSSSAVAEIGSPKRVPSAAKPKTVVNPLAPGKKAVAKVEPKEVPAVDNLGTAKTGEKGRSAAKVSKGRVYEKSSAAASKGRGAIEAEKTTYEKFVKTVDSTSVPTTKQADTARALQEKFEPGTKEHKELGKIAGRNVTESAQTLATIDRNVRKKASAKEITNRFANKLYTILDDDRTVNKQSFKKVEEANRAFEIARKNKDTAYNKFQADPSDANLRAFERATQDFTKADTKSLFEEYNTLAKAIKDAGTKNTDARKYLEKLRENSGIYFMDYVDSNLLSSTRVMINNYLNTATVAGEEALFGKVGAAVARKLVPGAKVGGGSIRGQAMGAKIGAKETITEARLRQGAAQNPALKTLSNFTTTGNTLGDHNITGVAYSSAFDSYRADLKAKGYRGDELNRRAKVETLSDPDGRVAVAKEQALASVGLGPVFGGKTTKIESQISGLIASALGDSRVAKVAAKVLTRVGIGFPTVVIRGAYGGVKRSTLGFMSAGQAVKNAVTKGDPDLTALYIKNAIKDAGSGATMMGIGAALASTGNISGAYPEDQNERDAWKREGKTEYSIKLGGDWYNLPQALGVFALPFMIGANAQNNVANGRAITDDILKTTWETIVNLSPADQLKTTLDLLTGEGGSTFGSKLASLGSSAVKAVTPLGSLVNQLAKAFDPTANDTTQGDALAQFVSKVQDGVPGLNASLPDKKVEGRVIENPSPIARMLGAVSKEQTAGVETTKQLKDIVIAANKQIADNGAFSDDIRNLMADDEMKALFDDVKSGKNTDPSDSKKIYEAITKNVTATEDTRFLEDGNYDANIAVLKTKRDLLAADPTTRKEAISAYDEQIARGQVYKDNQTPYELTQDYSKTSLSEWRKMGDPDSDEYNPEKYQALWDLDSKLAAAGGSRNSDDPKLNKFSAKESRSGRGGGGSGGGRANAKASANAIIAAAKDSPTAKLPDAPKVKQAVYRRFPVSNNSLAAAKNRFAPITISARSRQSKKA